MSFEKVITAWQKAAGDLKIKIYAPFVLTTADNKTIIFDLLIENFGNKLGTLISSIDNHIIEFDVAKKYGYYYSLLNPKAYSTYEREHFIDTLNDWGYYGDQSKMPKWYTGQPWT
jgi:hypothetical protein